MAKVRPEEGHVWQRKMGATVSARMSRRVKMPRLERETAFVRRITNSHVYYRRDSDEMAGPTHMIELAKFIRLFAFVYVFSAPTPSPAAAVLH